MSDLPAHPETGPARQPGPTPGPAIRGWGRHRKALVIVGAVGALVLLTVLHLTGVLGAESH